MGFRAKDTQKERRRKDDGMNDLRGHAAHENPVLLPRSLGVEFSPTFDTTL